MKRIVSFVLILVSVLALVPTGKVEAATKKYDVKSGYVEFFLGSHLDVTREQATDAFVFTSEIQKDRKDITFYVDIRDLAIIFAKFDVKFRVTEKTKTKRLYVQMGKSYKATGKERSIDDRINTVDEKQTEKSGYTLYFNGKKQKGMTVYKYESTYYVDFKKLMKLMDYYTYYVEAGADAGFGSYFINPTKTYAESQFNEADYIMESIPEDPDGVLFQPYNATELLTEVNTFDEYNSVICYMQTHNIVNYTFEVPNKDVAAVKKWDSKRMKSYKSVFEGTWESGCPEFKTSAFTQGFAIMYPSLKYEEGTTVEMRLRPNGTLTDGNIFDALTKNAQFYNKAYELAKQIKKDCNITKDLTDEEKAKRIMGWLYYTYQELDEYTEKWPYSDDTKNKDGDGEGCRTDSCAWYSIMYQMGDLAGSDKGGAQPWGSWARYKLMLRYFGMNTHYLSPSKRGHSVLLLTTKEGKQFVVPYYGYAPVHTDDLAKLGEYTSAKYYSKDNSDYLVHPEAQSFGLSTWDREDMGDYNYSFMGPEYKYCGYGGLYDGTE